MAGGDPLALVPNGWRKLARRICPPRTVFEELQQEQPEGRVIVVTHGDTCANRTRSTSRRRPGWRGRGDIRERRVRRVGFEEHELTWMMRQIAATPLKNCGLQSSYWTDCGPSTGQTRTEGPSNVGRPTQIHYAAMVRSTPRESGITGPRGGL